MSQTSLRKRLLSGRPILLDGSMGTEIARRGVSIDVPDWSAGALLTSAEVIGEIHREYTAAGVELLTANTFRTHARSLGRVGRSQQAGEMTQLAVELARREAGQGVWVAGSQAPLEDCYQPQLTPSDQDLEREHHLMAENLAFAGVDVILAETHPTIREARTVVRSAQAAGLPVMVSFVCGRGGRLLSGESLSDAVDAVLPYDPLAVLANCLPAEIAAQAVCELVRVAGKTPVGVYANVGWMDGNGNWTNTDSTIPAVYADLAATWLSNGAKLIGGCCGTRPAHIAELRKLIAAHSDGAACPSD